MKKLLLLSIALIIVSTLPAQISINANNTPPHTSAMLEITSTNKGLLMPRMNAAGRIAIVNPAEGLMVYDSTNNSVWYYNKQWKELTTTATTDNNFVFKQNPLPSYNMSNASTTDSSGFIYDSGGPAGNYGNNENFGFSIGFPNGSQLLRIQVISLNTESPYDSLRIYQVSNPDTITLSGNVSNQTFFFDNSYALSLRFRSNNVNTLAGFQIRFDHYFLPTSTNTNTSQLTGLLYIPEKAALRGGMQTDNNWHKDSAGFYSISYGYGTKAKGENTISMGRFAKASGISSVAIGENATATQNFSLALGRYSLASEEYAMAFGYYAQAKGTSSNAFGRETNAIGAASTAMGFGTNAIGLYSVAMGYTTSANGFNSTALGYNTAANASYSTALGVNTTAKGYGSTVVGMYNDSIFTTSQLLATSSTPLFIIGNGDAVTRSNAMVVRKNGDVEIPGTIKTENLQIGNGSIISKHLAGEATAGNNPGGSGFKTYILTFPSAFSVTPKLVVTAKNDPGQTNLDDTFVVSIRSISTTQAVLNIQRVDINTGWSQSLRLEWMAWE